MASDDLYQLERCVALLAPNGRRVPRVGDKKTFAKEGFTSNDNPGVLYIHNCTYDGIRKVIRLFKENKMKCVYSFRGKASADGPVTKEGKQT